MNAGGYTPQRQKCSLSVFSTMLRLFGSNRQLLNHSSEKTREMKSRLTWQPITGVSESRGCLTNLGEMKYKTTVTSVLQFYFFFLLFPLFAFCIHKDHFKVNSNSPLMP